MTYYMTKRAPTEGSYPKFTNNKVISVTDFGGSLQVLQRTDGGLQMTTAYGMVKYEKPISNWDADAYDMVPIIS